MARKYEPKKPANLREYAAMYDTMRNILEVLVTSEPTEQIEIPALQGNLALSLNTARNKKLRIVINEDASVNLLLEEKESDDSDILWMHYYKEVADAEEVSETEETGSDSTSTFTGA